MEDTEQRGPGIENGSKWSNGTVHFDRTGPTEKSGPPRKVDSFFRNFSGWTELIHSVLDRNFWKFWLNGLRPVSTETDRTNSCKKYKQVHVHTIAIFQHVETEINRYMYLVVLNVLSYCHIQIGMVFLIRRGSRSSVSIS